MHTQEQIESLVTDFFDRLSSDGRDPVGACFNADGRYEAAYAGTPNALVGPDVISTFFHECLPAVLNPFRQWADVVYPVTDGATVAVEGRSHGTAVHDGSTYENRYAWIMKLRDGRFDVVREYFNPVWYEAAIGPQLRAVIDEVFGSESHVER